jgi:hypothetical protein
MKQTESKTGKGSQSTTSNDKSQVRGSELRDKMTDSQNKGEQFRANNQGQDSWKSPNTSNTTKNHTK